VAGLGEGLPFALVFESAVEVLEQKGFEHGVELVLVGYKLLQIVLGGFLIVHVFAKVVEFALGGCPFVDADGRFLAVFSLRWPVSHKDGI